MKYRRLEAREIIQPGDEMDASPDGWKGDPKWVPAVHSVGDAAPDPSFPAHRIFRRSVEESEGDLFVNGLIG